MHTFEVWAPRASRVDVQTRTGSGGPWTLTALDRVGDGWWQGRLPDAGPGTDYAFRLDGGPARPDPRSAWQPAGVHGPSRVFDAGRHRWRTTDWPGVDIRGKVHYELHVGTFTEEGTLAAAATRLGYLRDLGAEVVELMPVAAFPGRWGWGYDGVDLYAVHEPYGGPAALQEFVDDCHGHGLGVCLDVVYNHLGPSGNYLDEFGPYFTDRHETPWGRAVNLDGAGSEHVRRWICDNARWWFEQFRVDSLRLDAVHSLVDDSPTHLLAQLSTETAALAARLKRPLCLVAESDLNDPRTIEPVASGGLGMTAQWADDVHHALHAALTGERQGYYVDFGPLGVLATVLTSAFWHAGTYSTFRGRQWGRRVDRTRHDGHSFVAFLQNHDQVGNRATGDRLAATLDQSQLAMAAALLLLGPFTPLLFMGEEWGSRTPWQFFTDHSEPELAAAVSLGRRQEFAEHGWPADQVPDPQDPATRAASVLSWPESREPAGAALLGWYRALLRLRRAQADLRDGGLDQVAVEFEEGAWLLMYRGEFAVAANFAATTTDVPLPADHAWSITLAFQRAALVGAGVRLGCHGVAVLHRNDFAAFASP